MTKAWWRRFRRSEQGSIMVETALMLMILLIVVFGIVDMGRALYTTNSLVAAAREGARAAAADVNVGAALILDAQTAARDHFNPFGGSALTLADPPIQVTCCTPALVCSVANCDAPSGRSVRVRITYTFTWITPVPRLMKWTTGSSFTSALHAQAEYKYEL